MCTFHPDIASQFETVPLEVEAGWLRDEGGNWAAPTPPALVENRRKVVTRTEYYGMFTATEEALIRLAATEEVTPAAVAAANASEKNRLMSVASLAVMLNRTDAIGAHNTIDLANPQTQAGLGLLVAMNLLTQARKEEIELGI
jgi:hypothetical protein